MSPSFILSLENVISYLHNILLLLLVIEARSWEKKTKITFQLEGVSVAVMLDLCKAVGAALALRL